MKRWTMLILAAALTASAAGAVAQTSGSDSEAFLTAVREADGDKVIALESKLGPSVLNYRGHDGGTPLTVAMANRSGAFVSFLLGKGADPNIADKSGDTALITAARSGYFEGVDAMLDAKANVDAANRQGETALIVAVQGRFGQVVKRLLEAGADADKTDFAAGYSAREYARRDTRNPELLRLIESAKSSTKAAIGPSRN